MKAKQAFTDKAIGIFLAFKVLLLDEATAIGGSGPPGPTTPKRIVIKK